MFSKRQGPDRDDPDPAKRLKANLDDLFLSNIISGERTGTFYSDGSAAGLQPFHKMAKISKDKKNAHRNILRALTRYSKWPCFYAAPVRVWCPKKEEIITVKLPMLLPHELVRVFALNATDQTTLFSQ